MPRFTFGELIVDVRALFPHDWVGRARARFRRATEGISDFAEEQRLGPRELASQAVELGRRKLDGVASKEYAAAMKDFGEAEGKRLEAELKKRSLESDVRKKEAEARHAEADAELAEVKVVAAKIELFKKLKEAGVPLRYDDKGNIAVLPGPENFDPMKLSK
jgi:hypothetical protein